MYHMCPNDLWKLCGNVSSFNSEDKLVYSCLGFQWKREVKLSANWLYSSLSASLNRTPSKEHKVYLGPVLVPVPLLLPLSSILSPSRFPLSLFLSPF